MSTKTQIDSAIPEMKTVKKPVAKKSLAAKKKSPVKKTVNTTKPSVKKASPKKVSSKKTVVKKSGSISIAKEEPMMFSAPSVAILENEIHHANKPVEIQRKIILVGTCRNCDHMPMGVNKLVAVLSLAIALLSGMLIYSSSPMQFRMPSLSMNSLTQWVTPNSHVKNL